MAKMKKMKVKQVSDMMQGKLHDHLGKHKEGMAKGHSLLEKVPAEQITGSPADKYKKDDDGDGGY